MRFEAKPRPSVLVVDDNHDLADLFVTWLSDDYLASAVYSGEEALEELHAGIDVVVLDRHLPGVSGDEVLVTLRDRGLDCRVVMVTGVTPGFDILELGFDDYLIKPIERERLQERVSRLVEIDSFDALSIRLSSLRVHRNVLQEEKSTAELADSEGFQRLKDRIAELKDEIENRRLALDPIASQAISSD